jgi:hypothetical protein
MDLSIRHHDAGPAIRVDVRPPLAPPAPVAPPLAPAPAAPRERFVPLHGFGCGCGVCQHERYFGEPLTPRPASPPSVEPNWREVAPNLWYDSTSQTYKRI